MSSKELLHEAAERGDKNEAERLLDEEGVEVDSKNGVCFCTLLAHLGAVWDSLDTLLS